MNNEQPARSAPEPTAKGNPPDTLESPPQSPASPSPDLLEAALRLVSRWKKYAADDGTMGDLLKVGMAVGDLEKAAALSSTPRPPESAPADGIDLFQERAAFQAWWESERARPILDVKAGNWRAWIERASRITGEDLSEVPMSAPKEADHG